MRHTRVHAILCSLLLTLTLGGLVLLAACASAPDRQEWIRVGQTTKAEVIARYGQPDLIIASPGGYTAVYRPTASGPSAPRPESLLNEIRIRYDGRGIVQELSSP